MPLDPTRPPGGTAITLRDVSPRVADRAVASAQRLSDDTGFPFLADRTETAEGVTLRVRILPRPTS